MTAQAGPTFSAVEVSRGLAVGDLDNDGYPDLVVLNNSGDARVLRNQASRANHWIGFRLLGKKFGRDMLGARVEVLRGSGPSLWRRVRTDGSYASASDPRVLAGLGAGAGLTAVRVYWPDGRAEEWTGLGIDRYHTLREDSGKRLR